jgi:hypothetical protein
VHFRGILIKESKKTLKKEEKNQLTLCFEEQDFSLAGGLEASHRV